MTRSTFFKAIPAVIAGLQSPKLAMAKSDPPMLQAYVDVREHDWHGGPWVPRRVILDGRDLSNICFRAEMYTDGSGVCFCYKKRDGQFVLTPDRRSVETEVLTGRSIEVRIEFADGGVVQPAKPYLVGDRSRSL